MTANSKSQVYRNTNDDLDRAILGMEAFTVLLVNALHHESNIVGSYADGIDILLWEKIDALKSIQENVQELKPDEDKPALAEAVDQRPPSIVAAVTSTGNTAELAAALGVDAELVERVASALRKPKDASKAPPENARAKRAAG